ncbi:hypothetical protein FKP32DRAFT_1591458 [Trametes sanguinea]|nr:hypothetical protein FKP32DRAFT_1591458 [Trametes sanguinea]
MSEQQQPSGGAGASGSGPSGSGASSSSNPPKVIPSLAKKQGDVTRLGTQKLKFVPTLPSRRAKEEMDWMAPESLRKERDVGKKGKKKNKERVKKEEREEGRATGATSAEAMDVDRQDTPGEEQDEEELEDIIDDFAQTQLETEEETDVRQERLYFFQFPHPFPVFKSPDSENAALKGQAKEEGGGAGKGEDGTGKKVSFAEDTKPPASAAPGDKAAEVEAQKVDGVVGQLEIYESGAVKLRMGNGILMDVTAATQPSFLQHAVYVDGEHKRLCVLGEVNRRFVVTPDIETLLTSMELADNPPTFELGDGLLTMDTT